MNKIIVFGAAGGTGKKVVQQALQLGYEVKAIVRKPEILTVRHPKLTIVKGDVLQIDTFQNEMEDVNTVISCLGIPKVQPTTLYSESMVNIIAIMKRNAVRRILCVSSGAIDIPPNSSFIMTFLLKNVLQRIYKPVYADMNVMEEELKSSGLDYTIVRAPKLTDGKRTNNYRIVTQQPLKKIPTISRADLAGFMLKSVDDKNTFKSTIEVAY